MSNNGSHDSELKKGVIEGFKNVCEDLMAYDIHNFLLGVPPELIEDALRDTAKWVKKQRQATDSTRPGNLKFVVLGHARSGTSMLSRCLHNTGFNLGEPYHEANEHNPHGLFESKAFCNFFVTRITLNLKSFTNFVEGRGYVCYPEHLQHARAFLKQFKADGVKHPLITLTWELWKQVLPKDVVLFTITRKKEDVLASKKKLPRTIQLAEEDLVTDEQLSFVYDGMLEHLRTIEKEWGRVVRIHFDEMLTPEGQAKIQKRFAKYFPDRKLDFSTVKSNEDRRKT